MGEHILALTRGGITSRSSGPGGRRGALDSRSGRAPAQPLNVGPLAEESLDSANQTGSRNSYGTIELARAREEKFSRILAAVPENKGRRQATILFNPERDIRKANLRRFLVTFCSAALAAKSEFSSSAITIHIHLLDPDVDRSMAEFEECRLEWSWILIGTSGGGGRDFESVPAS
jgi:hypothetical protein